MKNSGTLLKVIGTIVAIGVIIFIIVRYGDKIVAWTKRTLAKLGIPYFQGATIFDADEAITEDDLVIPSDSAIEA